jgi:hypothetical protein
MAPLQPRSRSVLAAAGRPANAGRLDSECLALMGCERASDRVCSFRAKEGVGRSTTMLVPTEKEVSHEGVVRLN